MGVNIQVNYEKSRCFLNYLFLTIIFVEHHGSMEIKNLVTKITKTFLCGIFKATEASNGAEKHKESPFNNFFAHPTPAWNEYLKAVHLLIENWSPSIPINNMKNAKLFNLCFSVVTRVSAYLTKIIFCRAENFLNRFHHKKYYLCENRCS